MNPSLIGSSRVIDSCSMGAASNTGREEGAAVVEEVIGRPRTPRLGRRWLGAVAGTGPPTVSAAHPGRGGAREGPTALARLLETDYGLNGESLQMLADYFHQQETMSEIPDAGALLVEVVRTEGGAAYYLHTPLNRLANDALARVAVARLARDFGRSALSVIADLGFVLQSRSELPDFATMVRRLLAADGFRAELDASLAESQMLRARFARVAQTGLMVLRNPEGRRQRVGGADWPGRRLFEQVRAHDAEFVLLRQALAEVRAEQCDFETAGQYAAGLPSLAVRCRSLRQPSPFAAAWTQPGVGEAGTTQTPAEALHRLHAELTGGAGDASAG